MKGIGVLILSVFGFSIFTSCEDKASVEKARGELAALKDDFAELEAEEIELRKVKSERNNVVKSGSSSFLRRLERTEFELEQARTYADLLEKENDRLERLLDEWRRNAKTYLRGTQLDKIVTLSGEEISNIQIKEIKDGKLFYLDGASEKTVELSKLNEETRLRLLDEQPIASRVTDH